MDKNIKVRIFGKPLEYALKIMTLWPYQANIIGTVIHLSALVTTIPFQWWAMLQLTNEPLSMFDIACSVVPEILSYIKMIFFWMNRSTLLDIIREMSEDYEKEKLTEKWLELISSARRFCRMDFSLYLAASSLYYIQVIMMYCTVPVERRELLYVTYYPFDFRKSPNCELMFFMQMIQGLSICCAQCLSESLLVALVSHIRGCTDLLHTEIVKYSDSCDKDGDATSLKFVIAKYSKVLNFVNNVEKVYTYASTFQLLFSTLIMCLLGFIVLSSGDLVVVVKYLGLLMTMIWQIHAFCFTGQRLIDETDAIPDKLYNIPWYKTKPKEIKALMFIICRAQVPLRLTAANLFPLSAQTFTSIVKTSFSYLSVLRATYN